MTGEEIVEVSKAVQEVSKFGVKALESGGKLGNFIAKVTGLTDDGILGLIKDKLQFIRWERQCRMADEYNRKYKDQQMKPIPLKFLIPILQNGSLEDDNNLQDIWVNLLGSFTNKNYKGERRMAYIDIIKSLNPLDIYILKEIYEFSYNKQRDDMKLVSINKERLKLDVSDNDFSLSLANLYRVFCVGNSLTWEGIEGNAFSLTELGIKFVEACICNNKGDD
ncbi:Abi-alpha family protein [Fusobacterium sp. MFO224]|uniref:Abi-alpha family protein n=1 Tax=Fusobacterium sp. MFO224 TaxID=3378070 RepID=UPI0038526F2A